MSDYARKLTQRQRLFVRFYVESGNAAQSAIRAGYSARTARQMGHENLQKDYIRDAIESQIGQIITQPNKRPDNRKASVYLIGSDVGLVKIGTAKNVDQRLEALQTGSPALLHLIASIPHGQASELEARLHRMFADKRSHGEWFKLAQTDIEWILTLSA